MKPMIIVDLLQKFIVEQATLGGPFDGPDAFFEAMEDFLNSKQARRTVAVAWLAHMVDEGINSGSGKPVEEVFSELRKRSEQMLDVRMREETRELDRSRSWVVGDALEPYLEHRRWMTESTQKALAEIRDGRVKPVPHEVAVAEIMAYAAAKR